MRLVVDGLIFQKDPHGGIARLYREILPRLCDLAPDLGVTLFIDGPVRADLPRHPQILVKRSLPAKQTIRVQGAMRKISYPFRRLASQAWNIARQYWLKEARGSIWHSTYYTLPGAWDGPQIVTVYDMIHEQYPQFFTDPLDDVARRQKKRCVEQASAVVCISQATQSQLERFLGLDLPKRWVIPPACSPAFHRLEPPVEPVLSAPLGPFLLYVGKRVHYKNFGFLLEAYRNWQGRSGVGLVVVGPPWSQDERRQLDASGLVQQVHLLSGVDDDTLCRLYNSALALVFPSLDEGFGLPLLEAMACGCPVIASRIPSTLEVAADCPIYFESDQPGTLLSALDAAFLTGRSRARVTAGLERAKGFSWENTASRTLEVYREVWQAAGKSDGSA